MADYHLLTIWRIDAPLTQVYEAIHDSLHWPDWWPGAEKVEQTIGGDSSGINSIRRYSWRGELPYIVVFDVRAIRIEKLIAIEGLAEGDLEGVGRWHFSREGQVSVVHYEWQVRSTKWWMNLVAPIARPIFIRNHARIMTRGAEGLAHRLHSSLLSQENIDLMADGVKSRAEGWHRHQAGRIDPVMLLLSGVVAGTIATVAQLALWWLAGMPILETLFRDARLTATLVMGIGVLSLPSTGEWNIMIVATLIHFGLSVIYAVVPALVACRLSAVQALAAGALYGLAIYAMNLHGFTAIFPWFAVTRDWITVAAHVIFGIALAGCWLVLRRHTPPPGLKGAEPSPPAQT